ncbi:hypothetical protein CJF31_00010135 [Rutstroemia sp. NJR-2017a BVV2]|nr:hypothetical protein CJF31_00009896 [Rutstroemia sp. NJR-2017a BVV2]PQE19726.1 hypothetical protein CJF31_00010135 [Rutstroemia sp. NJR-2017a BVV2]
MERSLDVWTIGISGCTSSGKTVLALLLSEIFAPFSPSPQRRFDGSRQAGNSEKPPIEERSTIPSTSTIHQDAFFLPKALCPLVSFHSTPGEKPYIRASIQKIDENATYFYSWSGLNLQSSESIRIIGPNTDCREAVNFKSLLSSVQSTQSGCLVPELKPSFKGEDADRQKLAEDHADLIHIMREKVASFCRPQTAMNGETQVSYGESKGQKTAELTYSHWIFVEGFLLFSKDVTSNDVDWEEETDESDEDLYAEVDERLKPAVKDEVKRLKAEAKQVSQEGAIAKRTLMNTFDIKLFLPTSKEVAKKRRLTRLPYVDEPIGRRKLGQMWKTEGYFEDVVWRGYEKDFDWLLTKAGQREVNGVFVRAVDASIKDTVHWAVEVILGVLRSKLQNLTSYTMIINNHVASIQPIGDLRSIIIRFYTARLTQAAGILLRLPQDITAQANVLLFRYWLVDDLMQYEFSPQDISAATLYLTAKISASPRSFRSITNVYAYLLSRSSSLLSPVADNDPSSYYLSETAYITYRTRLLNIEGQVLNALGFNTHVALPHPLAITYLQILDVFSPSHRKGAGKAVAKRTLQYLNSALLSPQMLYLTHQPCALAVAAIYLAAKEEGVKMPENEWWEVFDVEREELGFLVVGMRSVEGVARRGKEVFGDVAVATRDGVRKQLVASGGGEKNGSGGGDEEDEMMRMMDEKMGDA